MKITLSLIVVLFSGCILVLGAEDYDVKVVSTGHVFTEGPAVDGDGNLYFTEMAKGRIFKRESNGHVSIYREGLGSPNGLALDPEGNVVICEQNPPGISMLSNERVYELLTNQYESQSFNSPNDICILTNGNIYFTDPSWGRNTSKEQGVYRISANQVIERVAEGLLLPNGISSSKDEKSLYVSETGEDKVWEYLLQDNGHLGERVLFANVKSPDGICVDNQNKVYVASFGTGELQQFSPEGHLLGTIKIPESKVSNCATSSMGQDTLYVTAGHSVYVIQFTS